MAQPDPNAPPESLNLQAFTGLKNTVSQERLAPGELERAVNIDLDDTGQPRRRRGYTERLTGTCHSAWTAPDGRLFVVKDGVLGVVREGWSFGGVAAAGADRLSYAEAGGEIFYSSRSTSGKVTPDNLPSSWGTPGASTWLSPVTRPTDTLGEVRGKLLGPPPLATEIAYWRGRIWMAQGNMLWATELYLYNYVDKTRTFFQFESDIQMIAPVDDGMYVGTEKALYFCSGSLAELKREVVLSTRAVPGSKVTCPASVSHPDARRGDIPEHEGVLFATDAGMCFGSLGGRLYNLTQKSVLFPSAIQGAGLLREMDGVTSYVAALDSGGDPANSARIGDYVEAEIRRFQG